MTRMDKWFCYIAVPLVVVLLSLLGAFHAEDIKSLRDEYRTLSKEVAELRKRECNDHQDLLETILAVDELQKKCKDCDKCKDCCCGQQCKCQKCQCCPACPKSTTPPLPGPGPCPRKTSFKSSQIRGLTLGNGEAFVIYDDDNGVTHRETMTEEDYRKRCVVDGK